MSSKGQTGRIGRRERRRQETADRIAGAGATLFAERGFAATTVTDICERADVARQTFFNHFATKQDLVRALSLQGHAFVLDALETARREERDTGARIARFFALLHEAARGVGPMHQDLVMAVTRATFEDADEAFVSAMIRGVEKLLRAGRMQGEVSRRHPLEDQAALVMGALEHLFFEWTHREGFPIADRSARMARLLADALAPRPGER